MGSGRCTSVLLLALLLAGCSPGVSQEPVHVGHLYLSRRDAAGLTSMATRGAQLALEEARAAGKEADRHLTLLSVQCPPEPDLLRAQAVRLITLNRAAALLGSCSGQQAEGLLRGARSYEAPVVIAGSLPLDSPRQGVWMLGASAEERGRALASYAFKELKGKKIATLLDERVHTARALVGAFLQASRAGGQGTVLDWTYSAESERADQLDRLVASRPDVVLLGVAPDALASIVSHLTMAQAKVPILYGGADVPLDEIQVDTGGASLYLVTAFVPDIQTAEARAFVQRFQDRFRERPDLQAALSYEGVRLLAEGLARAPGSAPTQLKEALQQIDKLDGVTGVIKLGGAGIKRPLFIVEASEGKTRVALEVAPPPEMIPLPGSLASAEVPRIAPRLGGMPAVPRGYTLD